MKLKRLISFTLSLVMICSNVNISFAENLLESAGGIVEDTVVSDSAIEVEDKIVAMAESGVEFAGGDGSEENPYQIATAEQFNAMKDYDENYYFILNNSVSETVYISNFKANLDGQNYSLTNQYNYIFNNVTGIVKNLKVNGNINFSWDRYYQGDLNNGGWIDIGGIAVENRGVISNCKFSGNIVVNISRNHERVAYQQIGGIAGVNYGTIEKCETSGTIRATSTNSLYVGGIVGCNQNTVISCYAKNNIYANSSHFYKDSYNWSTASADAVGIGYNRGYKYENCLNASNTISASSDESAYCSKNGYWGDNNVNLNNFSYINTKLYRNGELLSSGSNDDSIEKELSELNDIWYKILNDLPIDKPIPETIKFNL